MRGVTLHRAHRLTSARPAAYVNTTSWELNDKSVSLTDAGQCVSHCTVMNKEEAPSALLLCWSLWGILRVSQFSHKRGSEKSGKYLLWPETAQRDRADSAVSLPKVRRKNKDTPGSTSRSVIRADQSNSINVGVGG